MANMVKKLRMF